MLINFKLVLQIYPSRENLEVDLKNIIAILKCGTNIEAFVS